MRVEEEGDARSKLVNFQSGCERSFNVSYGVCEREGDLLNSSRTGFAYVIAAYRDCIPVRNFLRAETERVRD